MFAEEVVEPDLVLATGMCLIALGRVESLETFWRDGAHVADCIQALVARRRILGIKIHRRVDVIKLLGASAEEGVSGLDRVDTVVQMKREGPLGRTSDKTAVLVLIHVILGIQKALNVAHGQRHHDPILGRAVSRRGDAIDV